MATKLEILAEILKAQSVDPYYAMVSPSSVKTYVKQGLVETRADITDEDFRVAARLTQSGIDFVNASTTTASEPALTFPSTEKTIMSFEIVTGVEVPKSKRGGNLGGGGRKCKYPFDHLEVNQMFFVPVSEKTPEPWKSMVGVVSGANKRYAVAGQSTKINRKGEEVPVLVYVRKFVLRQYEKDGIKGAGIWREK